MVYLHKSVFQSHGYLSSANCHVDSRWVLKVSGFALHAFAKDNVKEEVNGRLFRYVFICLWYVYNTIGNSAAVELLFFQKDVLSYIIYYSAKNEAHNMYYQFVRCCNAGEADLLQ